MNNRLLISSLLFSLLLSPAFAKKKNTPLPDPPRTTVAAPAANSNYVFALSAANRFLQAWQTQDHEAGLLLLTDSAKHVISEEKLETMFSPEAPVHRGYQIARGKKLSNGRYTFPVILFEAMGGRKPLRTRNSQIIAVQTGKDDWAIDRLP